LTGLASSGNLRIYVSQTVRLGTDPTVETNYWELAGGDHEFEVSVGLLGGNVNAFYVWHDQPDDVIVRAVIF